MPAILRWMRRRCLRLSVLPMLLLAYAGFGYLLLPTLARDYAVRYVEQDLQRQLQIGELRFDPFRFELRMSALKLSEADGTPLLGFDALLLNADPLGSLFARAITLAELRIDRPDLALIIDKDGTLNLLRLLPPSDAPPQPQPQPQALPLIRIGSFAVNDGRLALEDRSRPQPFAMELTPIRFALSDFRTEPQHDNQYQFSAASAAGEQLEWNGGFSLQPFGSQGRFSLRQLQLATLDSYLQNQLPVKLAGGSVDLHGDYQLTLAPALDLTITLPAVQLRELAVAERAAPKAVPLKLREATLDSLQFALARRELGIAAVRLAGAQVDLRREADGSLNLMRLMPAATATPPAEAPRAEPAAPWQIKVAKIELADSRVQVEDRAVSPATRFTLAPISATVSGFSSASDASLAIAAAFGIDGRARLRADGQLRLQPLLADFKLDVDRFALPPLQPYLQPYMRAQLRSGTASTQLQLRYAAQGQPRLRVAGDVQLDDFALRERGGDDVIKWRRVEIRQLAFTQQPDRLDVDTVLLREPYARVEIDAQRQLNVAALMQPATPAPKTAAPAAGKAGAGAPLPLPLPLRVRSIRIDDGSAYFADRSITPSFATGIVALGGDIGGVSTAPGARATLKLQGRVDRYSPVEISGHLAPLAPTDDSDLRLSFRNIELSTFNPYSGKFAGYNIARGKLSTELRYRLDKRALQAEHHVVLDQLEFGEATGSKDVAPLPIKLAVALLKDRHGVIDLQLPVGGSLDDPQFSYGQIVRTVLMNTLSKIVTAPFAALGSLFGGSGEELAYVDFAAGSAQIDDAARGKLDKLAQALAERPQLRLDVPMASGAADAAAMADLALAQRVPPGALDDKARLKALERAYRELYGSQVRYPKDSDTPAAQLAFLTPALRGRLMPEPLALETLGRQRAEAVQAALLARAGVAPERIFIVNAAAAGDGGPRRELKVK